tara:strand:- start:266 stop:889 length:624 start_codon:yes stop_codon:yes gene_type:complete
MLYDPVEVVIDKTISTFRLKDWQYDIEDLVEEIAEALKLIGAAKIYEDRVAKLIVNSYVAKLPYGLQHIKGLIPTGIPYTESGSFIEVNEPDGTEIYLEYQGMPLDTRGYVLVPDSVEVREALMWYIVKIKCLQKEITVVSFEYADREWDWRCGSARASLNAMSVQDMSKIHANFTKLNPAKDQHLKNYTSIGLRNTLDREKNRDNS